MRILLLLMGFLFVYSITSAQRTDSTDVARRFTYFNHFLSGGLFGKDGSGTTVSFSTTHGVRYKRVAFGLGLGYDDYTRSNRIDYNYGVENTVHWKSLPVFAVFSVDLLSSAKSDLFIQLNGGYSKIWAGGTHNNVLAKDVKGGMMMNPLAGYRLNFDKSSIYLAVGYKWQINNYTPQYIWIYGWPPATSVSVKETMERMTVQIGFGWH